MGILSNKQIQSSVGLSIIVTLPNISVLINHIKAMHNAGGNVAIIMYWWSSREYSQVQLL